MQIWSCKHLYSLGPRPQTNPSTDRFQYCTLYWKRYTPWMRSGDKTSVWSPDTPETNKTRDPVCYFEAWPGEKKEGDGGVLRDRERWKQRRRGRGGGVRKGRGRGGGGKRERGKEGGEWGVYLPHTSILCLPDVIYVTRLILPGYPRFFILLSCFRVLLQM